MEPSGELGFSLVPDRQPRHVQGPALSPIGFESPFDSADQTLPKSDVLIAPRVSCKRRRGSVANPCNVDQPQSA